MNLMTIEDPVKKKNSVRSENRTPCLKPQENVIFFS